MKRFVRHAVVGALANRVCSAWLRPLWKGRASVFMLHREYDAEHAPEGHTCAAIAATLAALRSAGAHFVSLRELFERRMRGEEPQPGSVAFTIDDGYRDQAALAREFLRHECPATIFLITGFIDRQLWPWDEQVAYYLSRTHVPTIHVDEIGRIDLPTPTARAHAIDLLQRHCKSLPWPRAQALLDGLWRGLDVRPSAEAPAGHQALSWDEIRGLEAEGVDFGPHSVTHRVASQLTDDESRCEIETSWARLRAELERPLPVYAWPTGRRVDFGTRDCAIARSGSLLGAVSTNDEYANFRMTGRATDAQYAVDRFAFSSDPVVNLQYGSAVELVKQSIRAGGLST